MKSNEASTGGRVEPVSCFQDWQRRFVCLFGSDSLAPVEDAGPRGAMVAHQTSDLGVAGSSPAVVITLGADEHSRDLVMGWTTVPFLVLCWFFVGFGWLVGWLGGRGGPVVCRRWLHPVRSLYLKTFA